MKLLFLSVVTLALLAESKSSPLGQDGRKEDLPIQCLIEVLTKVVSKPDGMSLQAECKDILQKQGSSHSLLTKNNEDEMIPVEQNEKLQEKESNARAQEIFNALLKTYQEKREDLNEERSQEEFPNYYKRHYILTSKEKREDPENERSQEEFPNYYKRHYILTSKEKREDPENERSQEEFPNYYKRHYILTSKEKREDPENERSQEEFPNYYKIHYILTSKEKREDPDNERSQEEFPEKRYSLLSTKEKREYQDDERSQEEFPTYEHKRHLFLSSKEKRDDPDYDRSQEEFPSYVYKRYDDEDRGAEKQIWKPRKNHYQQYDEDFAQSNAQEKRLEEEESAKQYWNPLQQYHNKKHHKDDDDDSSDEEMESEEKELNEKKQHYEAQEEQKRPHSDAEERKQEKEAEQRYLSKKLNEHLLKDGEVHDKRNPWIYREYYHPAWNKRSAEGNEGPIGPSQKLEELANALRYKMSLLSEKETEGEKPYRHQRALSPEELKELEQQAQMN